MDKYPEYHSEHSITFSETTWPERIKKISTHIPNQIPLFGTVTASFWGIAEVIAEIDGKSLTLQSMAVPALVTALVISLYKAIQAYLQYYPDALSNESLTAKRIYRNGKCGWQFNLARQMLLDRIGNLDKRFKRIENGAHFILPKKLPISEYLSWLEDRPEILRRLSKAVAIQCTSELPKILAITKDESTLAEVKDAVEQLAKLYEATEHFEQEGRSIKPPDQFIAVHQMTFGWSTPIRNGITKFVEILDEISKLDVKNISLHPENLPNFTFTFETPHNIEEFCKEFDLIDPLEFH